MNLYGYLADGWCAFDEETQEFVWTNPDRASLFGTWNFRNLPPHSNLGILQDSRLSKEERTWRSYIKVIEAENWSTAEILHNRLDSERKEWGNSVVVRAATEEIPAQIADAISAELPKLAERRFRSAVRFLSGLNGPLNDTFFTGLGESFASSGISKNEAEFILNLLPNDPSREIVEQAAKNWIEAAIPSRLIYILNSRNNNKMALDFANTMKILDESWGVVPQNTIFERMEMSDLIGIIKICASSNHEASKALSVEVLSVVETAVTKANGEQRSIALRFLAEFKNGEEALNKMARITCDRTREVCGFFVCGEVGC